MQQRQPMMQQPYGQPYGAQSYPQQNYPMMQQNQGTYIPPDPQQYSTQHNQQPQQQAAMPQQQIPQQMPQQMSQQSFSGGGSQNGFGGSQNGYGGSQSGNGGSQSGYGGSQNGFAGSQNNGYGGGQMSQGQDYTPPPQSAPQGKFDPRLAQQLNNPDSTLSSYPSKSDPMGNYGISGHGSNEGILITSVRGGSRAAKAGLQKGDVIRTVDGNEVMQPAQLNQALSQIDASQTVPFLIFRGGNITPIQF
jgi:hypothetical protein